MSGFLREAESSEAVKRLYDEDLADEGYVMNHTRLWAHRPELIEDLFALMGKTTEGHFSFRQRAIMVTAAASAFDNAGCSLAWGRRLASVSSDETAGNVIAGDDAGLDPTERPLAEWARALPANPAAPLRNRLKPCARPVSATPISWPQRCTSRCGSRFPRSMTGWAHRRMSNW